MLCVIHGKDRGHTKHQKCIFRCATTHAALQQHAGWGVLHPSHKQRPAHTYAWHITDLPVNMQSTNNNMLAAKQTHITNPLVIPHPKTLPPKKKTLPSPQKTPTPPPDHHLMQKCWVQYSSFECHPGICSWTRLLSSAPPCTACTAHRPSWHCHCTTT